MKFMKPSDVIFSAIIFCSIFIRKSISVWSLFRLETNLNNLLFNHGLLVQLNGSTVSECSLKCLMMDNCVSFQIQDDLELCRLYWTYFLLPSTGTPSTGWKTYYSSGQLQAICDISVHIFKAFGTFKRHKTKMSSKNILELQIDSIVILKLVYFRQIYLT